MGDWRGKTLDSVQVHILLCVTLEKCVPIFCILISRLAKQDLEVCIEGPGEQESRPLREDCQGSKQAGSGQDPGADRALAKRNHQDPQDQARSRGLACPRSGPTAWEKALIHAASAQRAPGEVPGPR